MRMEQIQLFPDREKVTLTGYILDDSPEMLNGGKRPAVLICPGGAYMFCSDREAEPIALKFASMGYHAFVLRYSVFSNSGEMFPKPGVTPAYELGLMPGPMREIGKAMLTIREHADEWLVDTDKIILSGYSAGANNCALYAVNWDKPVITDYLGVSKDMLRPAGAILGYGVYDYQAMEDTLVEMKDYMRLTMHKNFYFTTFGNADPDAETKTSGSPAKMVSKSTPPMFVWATRGDNLVPVSQTILMAGALAKENVPFEVHIFENGDHGLATADQTAAAGKDQINLDVAEWIDLAKTWMTKRFALEMPDECPKWAPPE